MTSTGLQHALEKRIRLDLYVDLQAPYVIIPYGGKYTGIENVLVANLGRLKMVSSGKRTNINIVKEMYQQGLGLDDIFLRMKEHCYDSFVLELTDLQILIAQGDEDWLTAVEKSEHSDMHVLNPLTLSVTYSKCLITDDPRFPQNRITGELPSIDIRISEARLMLLAALGTSIPLPESDVPEPQPLSVSYISVFRFDFRVFFVCVEIEERLQYDVAKIQGVTRERETNERLIACPNCKHR